MSLSAEQIRMARAALKLTMRELAALAEIDNSTLVRIEAGYGAHPFTLKQLREVLAEGADVVFAGRVAEVNGIYLDTYRCDTLDYFFSMAERVNLEEAI